ncbi:hypothetical protein IMG5_069710 [Ichthyophthirius multifiliis]|uniref:Transmembrane protein n=1 Tax=Ichthyophthirius multifiliis TaxID=5932 RepID=G0QPM9_ICHMU|nr:hypothetical protein IMG5_069710 [Ichthyophthirius multifiliis]EGR32829.1 hypothetical protein IMG5_069710 [Ichthyophthirius multifiliis]|eukprot:XP_004036815.1 hypothetical protein IMG5_069710 [Ichthyophthirius multifiliis]
MILLLVPIIYNIFIMHNYNFLNLVIDLRDDLCQYSQNLVKFENIYINIKINIEVDAMQKQAQHYHIAISMLYKILLQLYFFLYFIFYITIYNNYYFHKIQHLKYFQVIIKFFQGNIQLQIIFQIFQTKKTKIFLFFLIKSWSVQPLIVARLNSMV